MIHSFFIFYFFSEQKQVISGGEDGLVLFWDARTNKPCRTLDPSKENSLMRSAGKYVGVVHAEKDWLVSFIYF